MQLLRRLDLLLLLRAHARRLVVVDANLRLETEEHEGPTVAKGSLKASYSIEHKHIHKHNVIPNNIYYIILYCIIYIYVTYVMFIVYNMIIQPFQAEITEDPQCQGANSKLDIATISSTRLRKGCSSVVENLIGPHTTFSSVFTWFSCVFMEVL